MQKLEVKLPPRLSESEIAAKIARHEAAEVAQRRLEAEVAASVARQARGVAAASRAFVGLEPLPWASGLISGPPGTGKTRAALRMLLGVEPRGVFVDVFELTDLERRASIGDDSPADARRLRAINGAEYLVVDDFGASRPTEFTIEVFNRLFSTRFSAGSPTVVTSNLTPAEIAGPWGARISSRLVGFGPPMGLDGKDWRRR